MSEYKRPFRIWDAKLKVDVRWRYYLHLHSAHNGALLECRWGKPGLILEVYNVRTGVWLGTYERTPTGIRFTKSS
jgi:hypothetical protein